MEFDYKEAWNKLALPAFNSSLTPIKDLYFYVEQHANDCVQSKNLNLMWPENETHMKYIKDHMFNLFKEDTLALAARVIYFYGHWFPSYDFEKGKQLTVPFSGKKVEHMSKPRAPLGGSHWHFSSYADQIIRKQLKVLRSFDGCGYGIQIHEGIIRACFLDSTMWIWEEVCPANILNLQKCKKLIKRLKTKKQEPEKMIQQIKKAFELDKNDPWYPWFNLKPRFYTNHSSS